MRNMSFYSTVTLPRKELTITNSPNQITHCTLYQIMKHYARFNMCNKQSLYRRTTVWMIISNCNRNVIENTTSNCQLTWDGLQHTLGGC